MPSEVVAALMAAQTIAAERENAVVQVKSLTVDNQTGPLDVGIEIQDSFNESAYYGNTALAAQLETRFKALVQAGDIITWGEEDLKGVKCLGALLLDALIDKATCFITVGYEHE
ncbi:hypothetical protein ES703_110416 [subsurface metagenome]